jgi:hypothetical protein
MCANSAIDNLSDEYYAEPEDYSLDATSETALQSAL